jgi:hypothetical protein
MTRSKYLDVLGTLATVAQTERQLRDVKGLVDRTLLTAQKYWLVLPLVAAGWVFVVSDDDRFAVLEGAADRLMQFVPLDSLERWLTA